MQLSQRLEQLVGLALTLAPFQLTSVHPLHPWWSSVALYAHGQLLWSLTMCAMAWEGQVREQHQGCDSMHASA